MARESCVVHPKGLPFIIIKQGYVNLFGGDHAYAALIYCFEHFTNVETDRMEREEVQGDPWFPAPMLAIVSQTTGLYSERSLKPRVLVLERIGLIKVQRGRLGQVSKYLLDADHISHLLRSRHVFSSEELSECKIAPEETPSSAATGAISGAVSGAKTAKSDPVLNLKEEEYRIQSSDVYSTSSSSEEENPSSPPETLTRLWNATKGLKHLGAGHRSLVLQHGPVPLSEEELPDALRNLSAWADKNPRNPLSTFLRDPRSWLTYRTVTKDSTDWHSVHGLAELKAEFDKIGAPTIDADWEKASPFWQGMILSDQEKATARVQDYDGAYMKRPLNYLKDREYTRPPRPDPKSAFERMMGL